MSTNGSYTTANFMKLEITKKGSFYKSFDSHDVNVEIAGEDSGLYSYRGADTFSVFFKPQTEDGVATYKFESKDEKFIWTLKDGISNKYFFMSGTLKETVTHYASKRAYELNGMFADKGGVEYKVVGTAEWNDDL